MEAFQNSLVPLKFVQLCMRTLFLKSTHPLTVDFMPCSGRHAKLEMDQVGTLGSERQTDFSEDSYIAMQFSALLPSTSTSSAAADDDLAPSLRPHSLFSRALGVS